MNYPTWIKYSKTPLYNGNSNSIEKVEIKMYRNKSELEARHINRSFTQNRYLIHFKSSTDLYYIKKLNIMLKYFKIIEYFYKVYTVTKTKTV